MVSQSLIWHQIGGRSFSIWDEDGKLVWDSGDDFGQYILENHPSFFNCNDGLAEKADSRSDDKGVEPEAVVVGQIGSKHYAFVGLERQGGVMVYDVTEPTKPVFENYINTLDEQSGTMADIAPEGLIFVPASESHTGKNLLVISHEVSGTTTIYEIVDPVLGINSAESASEFVISPNPTNGGVNIAAKGAKTTAVRYTISDVNGRMVGSGIFRQAQGSISMQGYPMGMYYISVYNSQTGEPLHFGQILKQ